MNAGDIIIFVLFLLNSCLLVGIGIPLGMGVVRPNPLYGFRTQATLRDPAVWYGVNRVAGFWLAATGVTVAVVAICTFLLRFGLPAAPLVNLVPLAMGIGGMIFHGMLVERRVTESRP
jgi:hypothetical protein